MISRIALVALALAIGSIGVAAAGTLENAFGNTVVMRQANGEETRYRFNADNTYSVRLPNGQSINGSWQRSGEQICMTPAGGTPACMPVDGANHSVGDTWTITDPASNSQTTASMIAGQEP